MGEELIVCGSSFTPLDRIATDGGEVMKALTAEEGAFDGFGEAYFSRLDPGAVRAWKRHAEMTVNAVVPVGHVRFVTFEDEQFIVSDMGPDHQYGRLTIQPGTWFGFQGGVDGGLVLNVSNIVHRPDEGESRPLEAFDYRWT